METMDEAEMEENVAAMPIQEELVETYLLAGMLTHLHQGQEGRSRQLEAVDVTRILGIADVMREEVEPGASEGVRLRPTTTPPLSVQGQKMLIRIDRQIIAVAAVEVAGDARCDRHKQAGWLCRHQHKSAGINETKLAWRRLAIE